MLCFRSGRVLGGYSTESCPRLHEVTSDQTLGTRAVTVVRWNLERRPRSWVRHVRLAVAIALAEALHRRAKNPKTSKASLEIAKRVLRGDAKFLRILDNPGLSEFPFLCYGTATRIMEEMPISSLVCSQRKLFQVLC